ncbi:MAG: FHA domain-containing protein [Deltaproteobacteria bacterium]|nr:FHA domain-containing protein [Deltaproteobacteria bacterium]
MRAFLHIVAGERAGEKIPLPETLPFVIGRKKGDLRLEDPMVSGVHARIVNREGIWVIRDLQSTNGTVVDGMPVREAALEPGSEVVIGSCRMILFEGPEGGTGTAPGKEEPPLLDRAWLLDEEVSEARTAGDAGHSQGDVIKQELRLPPGLNAIFEVVAGPDAGKVVRLSRGTVTIGRRTGEVPLADAEVSRRHTVVEVFGRDMIFLRDLGSTNGTFHNGRRVTVARLRPGDTVGVGRTVLRFQIVA